MRKLQCMGLFLYTMFCTMHYEPRSVKTRNNLLFTLFAFEAAFSESRVHSAEEFKAKRFYFYVLCTLYVVLRGLIAQPVRAHA